MGFDPGHIDNVATDVGIAVCAGLVIERALHRFEFG
jgi:hypothetical protein